MADDSRSATERARRDRERALVLDHLGLAESVAKRMFRGDPSTDEDLVQVAYVGLINSARRFDPARGGSFEAFAVPTISGELKRHLRDHGWFVRPPRRLQELRGQVGAAIPRLSQSLGHAPTLSDLAEHLGTTGREIDEAIACREGMHPASLDATVGSGESETLSDLVSSGDDGFEQAELSALVWAASRSLSERERRVIRLRFFEELSQREIAAELGVTQMQVSRILASVLERMRCAIVFGPTPAWRHRAA